MTSFTLLLLLQADPATSLREAVGRTRAESSFEVSFQAETILPGAVFKRKGIGRRCGAGVLALDYEQDGGRQVRAVRAGDRSWVYSPLVDKWMAPDEAGEAGVTYGLQNPDDFLRLIGEEAEAAQPKGPDLEIRLAGAKAVTLLNKLAPQQNAVNANLTLLLKRDAAGRIISVALEVAVNAAGGNGGLKAAFALGAFGAAGVPAALGPVGAKVKLSPAIRQAILVEQARAAVREAMDRARQALLR